MHRRLALALSFAPEALTFALWLHCKLTTR